MKLLKQIAAVLGFFLLPIVGYAAYGGITWGYDSAASAPKLSININGSWYEVAFLSGSSFVAITSIIDIDQYGADKTGVADSTTAIQNAIAAAKTAGGGIIRVPVGTYSVTGLKLYSDICLEGLGKNVSIIQLRANSDQHVIRAGVTYPETGAAANDDANFDDYANDSDRATPVGAKTACVKRLTIDGNKANQTAAKHGLAYYGVDLQLEEVEIKNAKGVGLYSESPGATFSTTVGRNLQTSLRHIEVHDSGVGNIFYNGQSDSTGVDIMAYQTDNAAGSYHIKFGQKATGVRWFGVHVWGDADYGFVNGANTAGMFNSHFEKKILLNNTTYLTGRIYETSTSPAITVAAGIGSNDIDMRVSGYKYALKMTTADQGFNRYRISHYDGGQSGAIIDPSGATAFVATTIAEQHDLNSAADGSINYFNRFVVKRGGTIGVNETSPQTKLHVTDTAKTPTSSASLTNANAIVATSDAQAINKGGVFGLGGCTTDSCDTSRLFGMIAGLKENGTTANTSGYLSFYTNLHGTGNRQVAKVSSAGLWQWPLYTTAGALINDASGNITSAAGLTATKTVRDAAGTGTCTLDFTNGVLTGGTC